MLLTNAVGKWKTRAHQADERKKIRKIAFTISAGDSVRRISSRMVSAIITPGTVQAGRKSFQYPAEHP